MLDAASLLSAVLLLVLASAPAPELPKPETASLSPGVVGLLAAHGAEPGVEQRLAEALRDARPETRATAARVAHVAFVRGLREALEEALGIEESPEAAREEIRALAALSGSEEVLVRNVRRFGGKLDRDLAEALARSRGPTVMERVLLRQEPFQCSNEESRRLLVLASRGQVTSFEPLARHALEKKDVAAWGLLIAAAAEANVIWDEAVLLSALRSDSAELAARTAWQLARLSASRRDGKRREAFASLKAPESSDADVSFAFELLARSNGAPIREDARWEASLDVAEKSLADEIEPRNPILRLLAEGERDAARRRYYRRCGIDPARQSELLFRWDAASLEDSPPSDQSRPATRTTSDLPRGLATDIIARSGCRPDRGGLIGAAEVRYNAEGRPQRVSLVRNLVSGRCDDVAVNLILLTLAPADEFPITTRPDVLVSVSDRNCPGSLDEPDLPEEPHRDANGQSIDRPVLEKRVQPSYPESARRDGKQGIVRLEALITRQGCVQKVRTLSGVDPRLDVEAVLAVSQWRYRPALADGKPVRVYLTVTVTFTLK